ncbi:hypothetical protein KIN20_035481 [Parelaphostrongylus tenuis]|uniref:TspO/MBR family protein n=1 Tax=Parelaphostrongylus tenuis TaxID=148309 RepID=A0AAD5RB86_PARTN|nr:hypothetical protein KIN20_035481 [Parelaphostrongylus tenuis]
MQNLSEFIAKDKPLIWTSEDTNNALLSTLIPGGLAVAGFVANAKDQQFADWWNHIVKKPDWAPEDPFFYTAVDVLTLSPLGYASYLVYKYGGGFDYTNTRVALGMYGANMLLALSTKFIVKNKCFSCLWKVSALVHLTAIGAAYKFYNINNEAGLWMIPYAIWTGFYACLTYSIAQENKVIKDM